MGDGGVLDIPQKVRRDTHTVPISFSFICQHCVVLPPISVLLCQGQQKERSVAIVT